jgi:hypothetical protein
VKEYISLFYEQKIFVKRKEMGNFEKIQFFPERIESDTRLKYEKYKMWKLKLAESKLEKGERLQREHQDNLRTQNLRDIIGGVKWEPQRREEESSSSRLKKNPESISSLRHPKNNQNMAEEDNSVQPDIFF